MRPLFRRLPLILLWLCTASPAEARLAELLVTDAGVTKPIDLDEAAVTAHVDYATARITYDLTFVSSRPGTQEGTFYFALPRDGYVHEFGMWVDGHYQTSAIVEAKAGRVAYESIVRRGLDPALLEWTAGNTFKMRVYPVVPHKPTRVRLTVGLPLEATGGRFVGTFPLDLGKVGRFSLDVNGQTHADKLPKLEGLKVALEETGGSSHELSFKGAFAAKNFLPPDEVRLVVAEHAPGELKIRRADGDDERFFEARVFPELPAEARPAPVKALVFWDFSLSEEEHLDQRLRVLHRYLAARKPATVDLHGFGQTVFPLAQNVKGTDWKAIEAAVRHHPYDGGTRLDVLADQLKPLAQKDAGKVTDLVLFTNGVDSFELFDFKRVKDLGRKDLHAFIVAPTAGANGALIGRFAAALDGVVLDQDREMTAAAFTALPWRVGEVKHSHNLQNVEPPATRTLFPKDGLVVRGQVKKDGDAELAVTVTQGNETKVLRYKFDTDVSRDATTTVPRLWAAGRINRLLGEKRAHAAEIKGLALKHQLMSPFTVMVVLEYCEDYAEFKLDMPKTCAHRPMSRFADSGDFDDDAAEGGDEESADFAGGGAEDKGSERIDFDAADIGGQRKMPMGDVVAADAAAGSVADAVMDEPAYWAEESSAYTNKPEKDTESRPYGFEAGLAAKAALGVDALYAEYVRTRRFYQKIPYFYIHTAALFAKLKRLDVAELVLSNVVEVRPGDARWLRIYAYSLVAWGHAKETIPLYRAVAELREEDPQSFRDFGLALEAAGQPVAAMRLFEKVYLGHWDARLEGMNRIIQHDLGRAALAALKAPGLSAENREKALRYAKADASAADKLVVTVSWDTDNTDIDLHVVEPTGAHVYFANMTPKDAHGRLSFDTTRGFGPEQYRNPQPFQGGYRIFLRYYSSNPNVIQDGTFARVDVKLVENGVARQFTKTVFLKDQEEVRTVLTFDYKDKSAPLSPPNFQSGLAKAKEQLQKRQFTAALATLEGLTARPDPRQEAQRYFHIARAQLGLKRFTDAEQSNQRALALDPNLLAAHFNSACAGSLAGDRKKAIFHLNLLADSLARHPEQRPRFLDLVGSDPDLLGVRGSKDFNAVIGRIQVGH